MIAAKIIDKKEHINHDTGTYIYHYNCMSARSGVRRPTLAVAPGTGDGLADRPCGDVDAQAVSDTGRSRRGYP